MVNTWISDAALARCPALAHVEAALIGGSADCLSHLGAPRMAVVGSRTELVQARQVAPASQRALVLADSVEADDVALATSLLIPTSTSRDVQILRRVHFTESWHHEAGELVDLPPLPTAVGELLNLLEDPECTRGAVVAAIRSDAALSANVLRVANSSYFGLPTRVGTVERAVSVLGLLTLKGVVLTASLPRVCPDYASVVAVAQKRGLLASTIVRRSGGAHASIAATAAMLMDVGQLVLARRHGRAYLDLIETCPVAMLPSREAEEFGVTHAEAGASLLDRWSLPQEIVRAVALSHALPHPARRKSPEFLVFVAGHLVDCAFDESTQALPTGWDALAQANLKELALKANALRMMWPSA